MGMLNCVDFNGGSGIMTVRMKMVKKRRGRRCLSVIRNGRGLIFGSG